MKNVRIIREHDIEVADIFVVMTNYHAETLKSVGVPSRKIYILGGGIPDPFGMDLVTYRLCRKYIEEAIDEFCKYLLKNYKNILKTSDDSEDYIETNGAYTLTHLRSLKKYVFLSRGHTKALKKNCITTRHIFLRLLTVRRLSDT